MRVGFSRGNLVRRSGLVSEEAVLEGLMHAGGRDVILALTSCELETPAEFRLQS